MKLQIISVTRPDVFSSLWLSPWCSCFKNPNLEYRCVVTTSKSKECLTYADMMFKSRCSTGILILWQHLFKLKVWSKCLLLKWVILHNLNRFCKVFQKHHSYTCFSSWKNVEVKKSVFFQNWKITRVVTVLKITQKNTLSYWCFLILLKQAFKAYYALIFMNSYHPVSICCFAVSCCLRKLAWFLLSWKIWYVLFLTTL